MYVFSLFAFRSLRSLHASRENPIGGEWVRRVTVSLTAYLNTPHFLFSFFSCAPSGDALLLSCSFWVVALGGNGCGSPVLGLAFRSLVSLGSGLSWPWCAIARAVLVPFPCMGGYPFSWCLVCAPLVSFVVWLVFRFKPGICAFAFRLWCSPLARGLSFGLRPTLSPSGCGLRPSPEKVVGLPSVARIQFFFHIRKKKNQL